MSVVIIQGPQSGEYYTKAQLPSFKVRSNGTLDVEVLSNNTTIFSGSYMPDFNNTVEFDIIDVLDTLLATKFDGSYSYVQNNFILSPVVRLSDNDNSATVTFKVMNINARIKSFDAIRQNFLTLQPAVKKITARTPERLTYLFSEAGQKVMLRFYRKNGTDETVTLYSFNMSVSMCVTLDVSFMTVIQYSNTFSDNIRPYYDVFVVDAKNTRISNTQRYLLGDESGREVYYMFTNSLGGIDTISCLGHLVESAAVQYNIGEMSGSLVQLDDSVDRVERSQVSGYVPAKQSGWIVDFVMTKGFKAVYYPETGKLRRIVLKESGTEINNHEVFTSFTFTYQYVDGDCVEFEPNPIEAQQLIVTTKIDKSIEVETPSRTIEIDYNESQNRSETGIMECTTSSGMMIQVVAHGYITVFTSTDKETWTPMETVFVESSTIRVYDHATQGSYWKVEGECKIESIKILT